jgi:hypothetical protein
MTDVLQRPDWQGEPRKQRELFSVRKPTIGPTACRGLRTVDPSTRMGIEADDRGRIASIEVCRSEDDVLNTCEQWKAALAEKGWV